MCGISKPLWHVADVKLICGAAEEDYHREILHILAQHFRRLGINASVVSNTAEDIVNKSTFYLVLPPVIGERWRQDYGRVMEKYQRPPFLAPTDSHNVAALDNVLVYQLPEHGKELLSRIRGRPNCTSFSRVSWQKVERDIEDLRPTHLDSITVVMQENATINEEDATTVAQYHA
jgi:hypothetical protein